MRQWIMILFILISLCGCSKKDTLDVIIDAMPEQTYLETSKNLNVDLEVTRLKDDTIRYRVIFNEPKANLDNVKAIALCDDALSENVPSFGFYDNDKCNLYIDKIDEENNFYEGLALIGLSKSENVKCSIYLSYEINGEYIEEYILLEGTVDDAS